MQTVKGKGRSLNLVAIADQGREYIYVEVSASVMGTALAPCWI